ncbi:MAG: DUF5123 domain-containing protein [Sphingobacteriaceae bacterium]
MKLQIQNTKFLRYILVMCSIIQLLSACKKDEFTPTGPNRLFRPTVKGDMVSNANWIEASWQKVKGADSYTVQISRDTFKTIVQSLKVDTNFVRFSNLRWNQLYQIQVRAEASDTTMNSKFSFIGEMKSAKFPTIITPLNSNDIIDAALILRWTNTGAAVTSIKVLSAVDSSLVKEVLLNDTDKANQFKRVTGLTGNTNYIIYLQSGETVRGWEDVKTKAPQVFKAGSNIIDLRGIDDEDILTQTLTSSLPSGSVILLDRGMTYNMSSYNLNGALTLVSGLGFGPVATIKYTGNFNFVAGSTIDSLSFMDLNMYSTDYNGKYVLNGSNNAEVGKITFDNCTAKIFRGFVRLQNKTINVNTFSVNNCVIDSLKDYALINVDGATPKVENISITNSTIYKAMRVVVSKNNSSSILIENCTFNEAPMAGSNYLINYNGKDVTNGIKISSTIIGVGWRDPGADPAVAPVVRGVNVGSNTPIDVSGTYVTSDYLTSANAFPSLLSYSGTSAQLFVDPENGDFSIRDLTFAGKATSGDPRWRP